MECIKEEETELTTEQGHDDEDNTDGLKQSITGLNDPLDHNRATNGGELEVNDPPRFTEMLNYQPGQQKVFIGGEGKPQDRDTLFNQV